MNAAQAILVQASVWAQQAGQTEPRSWFSPWLWVVLALAAGIGVVWYFSYARAGRGGPPTKRR